MKKIRFNVVKGKESKMFFLRALHSTEVIGKSEAQGFSGREFEPIH